MGLLLKFETSQNILMQFIWLVLNRQTAGYAQCKETALNFCFGCVGIPTTKTNFEDIKILSCLPMWFMLAFSS